jgi:hypothetical protein
MKRFTKTEVGNYLLQHRPDIFHEVMDSFNGVLPSSDLIREIWNKNDTHTTFNEQMTFEQLMGFYSPEECETKTMLRKENIKTVEQIVFVTTVKIVLCLLALIGLGHTLVYLAK